MNHAVAAGIEVLGIPLEFVIFALTLAGVAGLGFVSALFDHIPLTKLALEQGGYDWGMVAYAVGFGGSMIWFGSSAGVAITNLFPEGRSVGAWLKPGWHPHPPHRVGATVPAAAVGTRGHP